LQEGVSLMLDCFAKKGSMCKALSVRRCLGSACPFYKTKNEAIESEAYAKKLIAALPDDIQTWIADTYYAGEIRW
jgi:hypothetical protein